MQQLIAVAACVYLVVFALTIYFTRATAVRALGAAAGGVAVAVVGYGVELLGQAVGFWYYPGDDTGRGPLLMYPVLVLMFAVLALVGWRVVRRFGWRGEAGYLAAVAVLGALRDYFVAGQALGAIVLAPGPVTVLVAMACWAGLTALAQEVMRWVAGPAAADRLSRRKQRDANPSHDLST